MSRIGFRSIFGVSIHAPREGCDRAGNQIVNAYLQFQFTHPGRGATIINANVLLSMMCFNSRTPGGVRHSRTLQNRIT